MNLYKYFTTDNISGKKCTERWLSKNNKQLFNDIIDWCDKYNLSDIKFKRKVYHYINDLVDIPYCKTCNGVVKYRRIRDGYSMYCSNKCVKSSEEYYDRWYDTWSKNNGNNEHVQKRIKTVIDKYGDVANYKMVVLKNYKDKFKFKYGVNHVFELESFKEERKRTLKRKYGSETFNNPDKTRKTRIENGTQINDIISEDFKKYKRIVVNRTNTIYRNNENIINPYGYKRSRNGYHLDHIYSIKQGFLNNVPVEIITHPLNLKLVEGVVNLKKQDMCHINLRDLLHDIVNYNHPIELKSEYLRCKYKCVKSISESLLESI
jgi:hypothetical protein